MNKEKEADVVDRFLQEVPCHQMAYQAEPTSSSEVEGKLCFVADSQSPKVMLAPRITFSAEQKSRSSRNPKAPLLVISPRMPTASIQTRLNRTFSFVGGGTRHT